MLDEQDLTNIDEKGIPFTVRSVFIIDPNKKIRLTLQYPVRVLCHLLLLLSLHGLTRLLLPRHLQASTGRQFTEVLRCIDSLQLGDKNRITTPVNWTPGSRVIVHPSVSNEEAEKIFGAGNVEYAKPYLRFTTLKNGS